MAETGTPKPKSNKWLWIGGGFLGLVVLGQLGGGSKSGTADASSEPSATTTEASTPTVSLVQQLKNEVASAKKFKPTATYSEYTEMAIQVAVFKAWATKISEAKASGDPAAKKEAATLKSVAAKMQAKEFPRMRAAYVKMLKEKLWENDIVVSKVGNATIQFTGGLFAANKNIKDFHTTIHDQIEPLRFRQAQYKWYSGDDEFTYYDIKVPKDSELIE